MVQVLQTRGFIDQDPRSDGYFLTGLGVTLFAFQPADVRARWRGMIGRGRRHFRAAYRGGQPRLRVWFQKTKADEVA
jgi:hypothetical protein